MKHTETPVWRLTADCIRTSFRSSGRRHLILTGSRGSGKTALLSQLFSPPPPGITTFAVPRKGVYLHHSLTGITAQIGVYDPLATGATRRMRPLTESLQTFGADGLQRLAAANGAWVTIDEIGYLEQDCPSYLRELVSLFQKKRVAACIRKEELPGLTALLTNSFLVDLDDPFDATGCVIMASGLGQRFGGNKLMEDFHGLPLIARCLAATQDLSHRVVVTRSPETAAYCQKQQVPVLLHCQPLRSDAIRLGLLALGDVERCMFCPADQPLLRRDTVNTLALCGKNSPTLWRPEYQGRVGAPILFPKRHFPALLNLPAGKGGSFLAEKYPEQIQTVPVRDAFELMDADTRDAFRILLEQ